MGGGSKRRTVLEGLGWVTAGAVGAGSVLTALIEGGNNVAEGAYVNSDEFQGRTERFEGWVRDSLHHEIPAGDDRFSYSAEVAEYGGGIPGSWRLVQGATVDVSHPFNGGTFQELNGGPLQDDLATMFGQFVSVFDEPEKDAYVPMDNSDAELGGMYVGLEGYDDTTVEMRVPRSDYRPLFHSYDEESVAARAARAANNLLDFDADQYVHIH